MINVYLTILVFWLANSLILFLSNLVFLQYFVLGTYRLSSFWAGVVAGLIWTVIVWLAEPIRKKLGWNLKSAFAMFAYHLAFNFVALWLTARVAPLSGFGVVSFAWLLMPALLGNVAQYMLFTGLKLKV